MILILVVVGALLVAQARLTAAGTAWAGVPVGRPGAWVLGVWGLVVLLGGLWVGRRAPAVALVVLLPGCLLTSCTPSLTLSPALQARVVALADRLAALPSDPETGEPGAAALLAARRARVAASPPAASSPPLWAPAGPEEVSNVP
jgi:hypothetical protein